MKGLINCNIMSNSNLTFSSLIEYFKSKFNHNGVFLQEAHSSIKNENARLDVLIVRYFFLTTCLTHELF